MHLRCLSAGKNNHDLRVFSMQKSFARKLGRVIFFDKFQVCLPMTILEAHCWAFHSTSPFRTNGIKIENSETNHEICVKKENLQAQGSES